MTRPTSNPWLPLFLGVVLLLGAGALAADEDKDKGYKKTEPMATDGASLPTVTILSPEVSRSLEITRIPTSEPIPLIVGTYWSCVTNDQDFEICRIKLVVCTDDQKLCTEI